MKKEHGETSQAKPTNDEHTEESETGTQKQSEKNVSSKLVKLIDKVSFSLHTYEIQPSLAEAKEESQLVVVGKIASEVGSMSLTVKEVYPNTYLMIILR